MKKFLIFLLCIIVLPFVCFAGVGDVDNRYYVTDEMWATEPYKKFVRLTMESYSIVTHTDFDENGNIVSEYDRKVLISRGTCSAQYVSKNLILSAGHCVKDADEVVYTAENYKGEKISLKLIETPYDGKSWGTGDWAVWLVTDSKYYSDAYFDVKVPIKTTDVINAGFGWCRILSNEELIVIRHMFEQIQQEREERLTIDDLEEELTYKMIKKGMKPLAEDHPLKLKASSCKIVFKDCTEIVSKGVYIESSNKKNKDKKIDRLLKKFSKICNNQSLFRAKSYPDVLASTCDSWGGNSGGGYISENGKNLYGTCSYGADSFENYNNTDYMVSSKQFNKRINELIKLYDSKNSVEENIEKIPNNDKPVDAVNTSNSQQEVNDIGEDLVNNLSNVSSMSDEQFLKYLDKLVEYQVRYEQLKANEQSMANRMLTAATIAATGIGGMELAQGLAEQKADKEAESAMNAYISTMRCRYGNISLKAGNEEIELPGGNDETMMKLRGEYFSLAADLKERKEALGMKPGIESETILDKSQIGLYDNENVGITSGIYSSLYRAKMLNSEADQTQIDEAKETSKNRVVGGGTVAGVGVVGGAVGDYLINGKSSKQKDKK